MTHPNRKLRLKPGFRAWRILRHEDEVSDWEFDFDDFMESGESISTLSVSGSNITVDSSSASGTKATVFLSGGSSGQNGWIDVNIVTDNATPRTYEVRIHVKTVNSPGHSSASIW